MTLRPTSNRADHRPTVLIAAALLFVGLALAVISATGGSIAVSTTGLTVSVNTPQ
jgi:hypothetical protein